MPYLYFSDVVASLGVSVMNAFQNKGFDWTDLMTEMGYKVVGRFVDTQLDGMKWPWGVHVGRYGDGSPDAVGARPWEKNVTYEEFLKGKEFYAMLGGLAALDSQFRKNQSTNTAVMNGAKSGLSSYITDQLFFSAQIKNNALL
jgi:hypothetical protein